MTEQNTTQYKKLVIKQVEKGMPVIGLDGYAGEQDSTQVIYDGVFLIPNKLLAKNIYIGKDIKTAWCRYTRGYGWEISIAHWSNAVNIDIENMYKFECVA